MKPQELNQDEQKSTNGGSLGSGLLGSSDRRDGSNDRSDRNNSGGILGSNDDDERDSNSGLLGDVPLIGDIL